MSLIGIRVSESDKELQIKWNDKELSQDCKITSLLNCRYCKVLLFMCQFGLAILPSFYSGCCECMFLDAGKWKSLSHVRPFAPPGLYSSWNSLGQNTGVSSLSLLQGIFPTQEPNPNPNPNSFMAVGWGFSHIAGRFFTSWAKREAHFFSKFYSKK